MPRVEPIEINLKAVERFLAERGWTMADLSRETKLTYPAVYRVMRGQRRAGMRFVNALLKAGMSVENIFLQEGEDRNGDPTAR